METNKTNQTTTTTEQTTDQTAITINKENILSQLENLQNKTNEINEIYLKIKSFRLSHNFTEYYHRCKILINEITTSEICKIDNIRTRLTMINDQLFHAIKTQEQKEDTSICQDKMCALSYDTYNLKKNLMYEFDMTRQIPETMSEDKRQQIAKEFLNAYK